MINVCIGTRSEIKRIFLDYARMRAEEERIWLIDSLQIFDPYYLSRRDVSHARVVLHHLMVSRPFTLYQLRDKVFGLNKLGLKEGSTVLISSLDRFDDEARDDFELESVRDAMLRSARHMRCDFIVGVQKKATADSLLAIGGVRKWEGQ